MAPTPYAELHCHTNFSFLDGASAPDDLVERAVELGLTGLAVTDHNGLYGAVRFVSAAEAAGLHPVVGLEIELLDPAIADPAGIVIPPRRPRRRRPAPGDPARPPGVPARPRPPTRPRAGPPALDPTAPDCLATVHRSRRTCAGSGSGSAARISSCWHVRSIGWRSLCRLISHANMAGTKGMPRFSQALLAEHTEGLVALSGCRDGELVRRLRTGDRGRGTRGRRALRDAVRARRWAGHERLLHRAVAPSPPRRRLARRRGGGAGRGHRTPGRRHQRRPLRPARGPRAGRRPDRDPARPVARDARRPAPARWRVVPEVGRRAGGTRVVAGRCGDRGLDGGDLDGGRARGVVLGRSRLRAVPLPRLPGPRQGDAVLVPVGAVLGGRPEALPPGDLRGRHAARPRAGASSSAPASPSSSSSAGT